MSGIEVIGLISAIITLVDTSLQLYEAVGDKTGLPQAFRSVAARLPLVQDTLEKARDNVTDDQGTESVKSLAALSEVLASCHEKAAALNKILQAVIPADGAPRTERYLKALKTIPKATKVEDLMDGIVGDLEVMTGNYAVKAATRAQIQQLVVQLRMQTMPAAGHDGGAGWGPVTMNNMGAGSQYVHSGQGNQNVVSGRGVQINGLSSGPFYLGRAE